MALASAENAFAPLADGIRPDYGGRSIANVAASVLETLGVSRGSAMLPPLSRTVLPPALTDGARRVVLVVADGLGWGQLSRAVEAGAAPGIAALMRQGRATPVTSVLPSTTVAALASLSTGLAPRTHGLVGYRTFLPTLGANVNMIRMQPILGGPDLPTLGIDLATFFPYETTTERLVAAGRAAAIVTRGAYVRSPLSQMFYRSVVPEGYAGVGEMFARARRAVERTDHGFVEVYWDLVDTVAHAAGPASEEHTAEVAAFDAALTRELIDRVDDEETLLLLTADHGHVASPEGSVLSWNDHPQVLADLARPPTGEGRLNYVAVRDGTRERVRAGIERAFGDAVEVHDTRSLLASGAFGPGADHPEIDQRLGDLVLVARGSSRLVHIASSKIGPRPLIGHHGGVNPDEMLVPLVAARL